MLECTFALGAGRTFLIRRNFDTTQLSLRCTPSHRRSRWFPNAISPIQFGPLGVQIAELPFERGHEIA